MRKRYIPLMKRFYKKDPVSGKEELFGKDGYEHAFISSVLILNPVVIGFWFFFGAKAALIALIITFIILRLFWFWTEWKQEEAMLKADSARIRVKWTRWSKARRVDMLYPAITDTVLLVIWIVILANIIKECLKCA